MNWPHEFRYVTITRDIFARIQVWDLRTGAARAKPLIRGGAFRRLIFRLFDIDTAWLETMMAQEMEGTCIAVAGKLSDRVRSRVLRLLHPEAAYSNTMATGEIDGTPIVVSGDFRARVRVWDLRAGIECKLPLRRRTRKIVAVAVGEVDGDPVTIAGGFGGIRDSRGLVRLWDLRNRQTRGEPLRGHSTFVNAVAIGEADGIPIAVSGDADGTVRVWDLRTGQARGRPLRGHTGWIEAVAVGKFDGIPVAASGDNNGAILMWTLDRDQHAVVRLNARWELVLSYLLTGYLSGGQYQ